VIVLLSWIFTILMPDLSLAAGALLLVGCLGVLFANVMKAAHSHSTAARKAHQN
jgi:hypothetical protein